MNNIMSVNRSVQAAQRRRAGPTNSEPGIPGRGPHPSINSAQMFANQSRQGSGPNIPTGRLAGQQVALQQQHQQQQAQEQRNDKLSSVSKMTIAQAITLISLRLGSIESKLLNMQEKEQVNNFDEESDFNVGFLQSIVSRLETLENSQVVSSSSSSSIELNTLKQQFDIVKQSSIQSKTSIVNLTKENVVLKTQVENLKKELAETKELVTELNNLTMDNSNKILNLSMHNNAYNGDFAHLSNELNVNQIEDIITNNENNENNEITGLENVHNDSESNEIIGTELNQ